eukprot:PhF_6_TR37918/c0_g2_i1/m.56654/K03349/APC2; anaphase-promoting complex subunit 2
MKKFYAIKTVLKLLLKTSWSGHVRNAQICFGPCHSEQQRVKMYLPQCYGNTLKCARYSFFDVIRDYPESQGVLEEIRTCLESLPETLEWRERLAFQIRKQYQERLLHAGAKTQDILEIHITTVWVVAMLRLPKEECVTPIIQYLKSRRDGLEVVVRCLMNPEDLALENAVRTSANRKGDESEDEREMIDVVKTLLVSFGVDSVVHQYHKMLRDALVLSPFTDIDSHYKSVETMKSCLGDEAMQNCSVMMNDVSASKRLNAQMQAQGGLSAKSSSLIVSRTCWPSYNATPSIEYHPELLAVLDAYVASYKKIKPGRTIHWIGKFCTVELTIVINGSPKDMTLTFVQASAVLYLAREGAKTATDLSNVMKIAVNELESALTPIIPSVVAFNTANSTYSIQSGTLQQSNTTSVVTSVTTEATGFTDQESTIIQNSIMAMLKTGGGKSVTQIENTLRMFGQLKGDGQALKDLLHKMAAEDKIIQKDANTFLFKK